MTIHKFFEHLLTEIKENPSLQHYYRFFNTSSQGVFNFRKAYYLQRLQYIYQQIDKRKELTWDLGCGYGTTAIFLVLNGYKVYGTTVEYYFKQIEERMNYWSQFGDLSGLKIEYKNLFSSQIPSQAYSNIIVQDVLHHLEPINNALALLQQSLKPDGKLIACEENGNNLIQQLKLYKQRGRKRIITINDEQTGENYLMGNENIRKLSTWQQLLNKAGLTIDTNSIEYIRLFPPQFYKSKNMNQITEKEKTLASGSALLRNYFYFGLNFTAYNVS